MEIDLLLGIAVSLDRFTRRTSRPQKTSVPIDLKTFSSNLICGPEGVWIAPTVSLVSYPQHDPRNADPFEENSYWHRHRRRCVLDLARIFPPSSPVFDIGGGNGYMTLGFQQEGLPAVLVEPGGAAISRARSGGLINLVQASFDDVDFKDHSLPAVGLFDVLEHIDDDLSFLRRLWRKMIPGSRLYMTVPAFQALWSHDDELTGHFRRYRLSGLVKTLHDCGFRAEFASYLFSILAPPVFLFRTLPTKIGMRSSLDIDETTSDHMIDAGFSGRLLEKALAAEQYRLRRQRPIPFGTSCVVIAEALAP